MTDLDPGSPEPTNWPSIAKRLVRFLKNAFTLERAIDRLVNNQASHSDKIQDLERRLSRIEAQQELIIRLLERDSKT